MNFKKFAKKYASEINGDFRDYDEEQSVIVIQLEDERYQAVQGRIYRNSRYDCEVIQLKSTVCKISDVSDFEILLKASLEYVHSKFIVEDNFLRVEASYFMDSVNEMRVKQIIQEVGHLADEWELKITGKDIY